MPLVTTNQAVKDLFGIEGSELLRSKANSFLRNEVIPSSLIVNEGFSDDSMGKRGKKLLKSKAVDCLFNALVLDGFFNDTKFVKAIFEKAAVRVECVVLCEEILLKAQAVEEPILLSGVARGFITQLKDTSFNLRDARLTCPFSEQRLPQMDMTLQNMGLLYQLLRSQRLSLSYKDKILLCWLEQDLSTAFQLVEQIDSALLQNDILLAGLAQKVRQEYQEGESFNILLNSLPD
ncbi:hypothetical protein VHA01S_004_01010 [Vibrio halioticoli NBRC 102217]|uniref:Uncharacterized protein n=1 Tax=Vibrio halioticoli NBRC 102217 TaxID=1219072 RepID=V5FAW3_9VIBR|nr:hypothetical protein [Vibrio halioticoli]GAD88328.1 hypothetical protein VHA01S_004_01010 [Vibrio halioticoli NBRC 102217]